MFDHRFRSLSLRYHPLRNPTNMATNQMKFAEICEAHDVLSTRKLSIQKEKLKRLMLIAIAFTSIQHHTKQSTISMVHMDSRKDVSLPMDVSYNKLVIPLTIARRSYLIDFVLTLIRENWRRLLFEAGSRALLRTYFGQH